MFQRRFRMEHAIFQSVEDCHDIPGSCISSSEGRHRSPRTHWNLGYTGMILLPGCCRDCGTYNPTSVIAPHYFARTSPPPPRPPVTRHNERQPTRTATASTEQVPAWRSLLLASPSGGGTLVAACTTRGGTSAPQPDDLCTIATFVAGMQQMIPAPCSTFHLMHALWTKVLSHMGFFESVGVCMSLHSWYPMCAVLPPKPNQSAGTSTRGAVLPSSV